MNEISTKIYNNATELRVRLQMLRSYLDYEDAPNGEKISATLITVDSLVEIAEELENELMRRSFKLEEVAEEEAE